MAEAIDAWGGITYNDMVRVNGEPRPDQVTGIMQEPDGSVYFCLEYAPNTAASEVSLHEDDPSRKRIGCCAEGAPMCDYHDGYWDGWKNRWLAIFDMHDES